MSALLKNIRFQAFLLFVVAVVQYSNTFRHDYAWDDAIVITENERVQKGLSDIPDLFRNVKSNETQNRYGYRPIALLSFASDIQFFGMDPKAAHKINVLLYGLLVVVILLFLNDLFPESGLQNLIACLLFVVHPLHTEVVANIKSRDEILALGFGLIALKFFSDSMRSGGVGTYVASLLFFVLAFLSKESAVTFVGVAFILPWFLFREKDIRFKLMKVLPTFLFFGLIVAIRLFVYSEMFFESNDLELSQKGVFHEDGYVGNPLFDASISDRFATAFFLVPFFLFKFFVPYPLLHDYSFNQFPVLTFSDPLVYGAMILVVLLAVVGLVSGLKGKKYGFGALFFLITSSVYLHLVGIAPDIFAERFLFVPSLGLCVSVTSLLHDEKVRKWGVPMLLILTLPMFLLSFKRNTAWKDNTTLLKTDLPKLENCVRANYNYALLLHRQYYSIPEADEFRRSTAAQEVLKYYEKTFDLTDRLFNVYMDLGAAYMEFGHPDKAKNVFQKAMDKYPDLSAPYVQMGKYYMSFGKYSTAIPYMNRALRYGESNSDFHYLLAICLFNSGWANEAIEVMNEGEQLGTSSSAYYDLMARLYVAKRENSKAIEALKKGLTVYPTDAGLQQRLKTLTTGK